MPGIDLNLDLPTLAEPLTTIVSKLVTALSLVEDDLADKVTTGELNINAQLSANGQRIVNVGGIQLAGGISTDVGTLYFDGHDLWAHTGSGAVKITAAGAVNIAASTGIGGNYGSGTALVTYDLASQEYRFFADPLSQHGDIVADDVVLMQAFGGGSVRLGVDPVITTARSVIFKDLATSGISCMVYNATTSTVEDAATSRITNDVKVTTLNAAGTIVSTSTVKGTDILHTNDYVKKLRINSGFASVGSVIIQSTTYGPPYATFQSAGYFTLQTGLRKGDRLKSIYLRLNKTSGSNILIGVAKVDHNGVYALFDSGTYSTAGVGNLAITIASPSALADYEDYTITIQAPSSLDQIISVEVLWDHP